MMPQNTPKNLLIINQLNENCVINFPQHQFAQNFMVLIN